MELRPVPARCDTSLTRPIVVAGGKDKWDISTAPVGSFKSNGYGLFDIAGNVWEWQDQHNIDEDTRFFVVLLRGGSWYDLTSYLRVASHADNHSDNRSNDVGFRCTADVK